MIGEENTLMIIVMVSSVYLRLKRQHNIRVDGIGDARYTNDYKVKGYSEPYMDGSLRGYIMKRVVSLD